MLTRDELLEGMKNLESEHIERTRSFRATDKMGEAICAFANDISGSNESGYLLLGVNDDGSLAKKRVTDEDLQRIGGIKNDGNLLPPPSLTTERFAFPEGDVVVVQVFPSNYPPIRYRGRVWVRVGPRKSFASEDDLHRLEERRQLKGNRFEESPCHPATLDELDVPLFRNGYLPQAVEAEIIEDDRRPVEQQMASLRFYDLKNDCPTNLGMLLFGCHPELYIPGAYIQYVSFSGTDNSSEVLTAHEFKGPLVKSVAELDTFVKTTIAGRRPVLVTALREEEFLRYPVWSTRELLLNAIIHRDYCYSNAPIKFYEYDGGSLEIVNPGGLYGRANAENFPTVNDYRNPALAEAMKVLGYVNKFNRGIAKVKAEFRQNGNAAPIFDINRLTEFRTTLLVSKLYHSKAVTESGGIKSGTINGKSGGINLQNGTIKPQISKKNWKNDASAAKSGGIKSGGINPEFGMINGLNRVKLAEKREKVLLLLKAHPGAKQAFLVKEAAITLRTMQRILPFLQDSGEIEYRGSKKTGGWFVRT